MHPPRQFEFYLVQYVPDPVRNEFVHVGVLLHEPEESAAEGESSRGAGPGRTALKFTSDWRRVRCLHPDADIETLEAIEIEWRQMFAHHPQGNLLRLLEESLSMNVQMTRGKAHMSESLETAVEELMRMYVESPKREKVSRLAGRAAIQSRMRTEFERAGVWDLLRKRIEAAQYTRPGDPLRIDAGYRPNGVIRMFQAVSLDAGAEMAKVLAFSEAALRAGVERVEKAELQLTAIVEPVRKTRDLGTRDLGNRDLGNRDLGTRNAGTRDLGTRDLEARDLGTRDLEAREWGAGGSIAGDGGLDEERLAAYRFAVETMEEHRIRVLTTSDMGRVAETARQELRV